MMQREDVVAAVLRAAGGELVGRVRLQKTVYLLDKLGMGSGFSYEYHHYGPYSRDLDSAVADAKAFNRLEEQYKHRMSDGAMYSIFALKKEAPETSDEAYGELGADRAKELLGVLSAANVTVLELAATVYWLFAEEKCADWRREITKRKGRKVQGGRLEKAVDLLKQLGLAPPESAAA